MSQLAESLSPVNTYLIFFFDLLSKHCVLIVILIATYVPKFVTYIRIQNDYTSVMVQTNLKKSVVILNSKQTFV